VWAAQVVCAEQKSRDADECQATLSLPTAAAVAAAEARITATSSSVNRRSPPTVTDTPTSNVAIWLTSEWAEAVLGIFDWVGQF